MDCPNCKAEARIEGVEKVAPENGVTSGADILHYICVNPRCKNHRRKVGSKAVQASAEE